jgi:hypothetical protein
LATIKDLIDAVSDYDSLIYYPALKPKRRISFHAFNIPAAPLTYLHKHEVLKGRNHNSTKRLSARSTHNSVSVD